MILPFSQQPILTVCLNPTLQKTLLFSSLTQNAINRATKSFLDASGKGVNVSRVLQQLGCPPLHLTQVSGSLGELFVRLCRADGISIETIDGGTEPRFCTTVIDEAKTTCTELVEQGQEVLPEASELILEKFQTLLPNCRALIISGTKAPGFSMDLFPRLVKLAKAKNVLTLLDIRDADLTTCLLERPDYVKPNLEELKSSYPTKSEIGDEKFFEHQARHIFESYGTKMISTRGSKDCLAWDGSQLLSIPTANIQVLNPIGSGDAFAAGFVASLLKASSFEEALGEGQRCGSANAGQIRPGRLR